MTEKKNLPVAENKLPMGNDDPYKGQYKQIYKEQAIKLCALGAIDDDLANFFDVTTRTIYNWKNDFPDFADALRNSKMALDSKVVRSLFERATGYSHIDYKFASHGGKITDVKEYQKHYPPETAAMVFWLKNRQPALWRDKHHMELSTSITVERLAEGRDRARIRNKPPE